MSTNERNGHSFNEPCAAPATPVAARPVRVFIKMMHPDALNGGPAPPRSFMAARGGRGADPITYIIFCPISKRDETKPTYFGLVTEKCELSDGRLARYMFLIRQLVNFTAFAYLSTRYL